MSSGMQVDLQVRCCTQQFECRQNSFGSHPCTRKHLCAETAGQNSLVAHPIRRTYRARQRTVRRQLQDVEIRKSDTNDHGRPHDATVWSRSAESSKSVTARLPRQEGKQHPQAYATLQILSAGGRHQQVIYQRSSESKVGSALDAG